MRGFRFFFREQEEDPHLPNATRPTPSSSTSGRGLSESRIRQKFVQSGIGLASPARQERMFDDHRLLLDPIKAKRSAGMDLVLVAAEGMAAQQQA